MSANAQSAETTLESPRGAALFRRIDAATQLCAVIGDPVGHSLSPIMHNAAFHALGLNAVYLAFRVTDVQAFFAGLRAMNGFRGLSVTIPHKTAAMAEVDETAPLARRIGCINTVTREDDGRLLGANTDGLGALRAFEQAGVNLADKRVLFVGAGGAVRAVAFAALTDGRAAHVTILGRTPERVQTLVDDLAEAHPGAVGAGAIDADLPEAMESHDVVVQGTPLGMHPDAVDETPVPARLFNARHVAFEMVYRPLDTRFLREAREAGARVIPGTEMLLHQAVAQFESWTGRRAPVETMRGVLRAELAGPRPAPETTGKEAT